MPKEKAVKKPPAKKVVAKKDDEKKEDKKVAEPVKEKPKINRITKIPISAAK